jgi:hypothetical protein
MISLISAILFGIGSLSAQTSVQQWHPVDLTFPSTTPHANPFTGVTLSATFTGPGSVVLTVPGFYVGDSIWKVRFAPTRIGTWTYATNSNDSLLNGVSGTLVCVANTQTNVHGRLFVDSLNSHHFRFEDGTPYFLMGGEIDWLGLMRCGDTTIARQKRIIDMYAARGFTAINMSAYAWEWPSVGKSAVDTTDFGPPDLYAWAGNNYTPDHTRFNTAFWNHYDRVVDYLFQKGMTAYIFFHWYISSTLTGDTTQVNWPAQGTADDSLYFSNIVARYQAYPNIIWSFGKEVYYQPNQTYIHSMLDLIGSRDAYKRLRTMHDDVGTGSAPDYAAESSLNTNMDFRTSQQHSQQPDIYAVAISQRNLKNWPIYNAETGYEIGNDGGHTYSVVQSKGEVLKRIYKVFMAGAYAAYYYTYHGWDIIRWFEEPNGLVYYQYLTGFFKNTNWYTLVPSDNLITADTTNHCLAKPGSEYIVYLGNGGTTKLTIAGAAGSLQGTWMNGYSGAQQTTASYGNGSQQLASPWNDTTPAILWLHGATGNVPAPWLQSKDPEVQLANTTVRLELERERTVSITLFRMDGSHEATIFAGTLAAGSHVFSVKQSGIPAGLHLVVVKEERNVVRAMLYIIK